MADKKVLVLGASGYLGGSILSALRNSASSIVQASDIGALIRQQAQADILSKQGIECSTFAGLDDLQRIKEVVSSYDIVINAANTFKTDAAEAILSGLRQRQDTAKSPTHLIQTSGCGSLADRPVSGRYIETRVFSDEEDIFAYEQLRQTQEIFPQRTTDVRVTEIGKAMGVRTYIIMSPVIYGTGTGLFNRRSMQLEGLVSAACKRRQAVMIGNGDAEWDHIHVEDVAQLYELLVIQLLQGKDIPAHEQGIFFSETGFQKWRNISEHIAKVGKARGFLLSDDVQQVALSDPSLEDFGFPSPDLVELAFASRSRTEGKRARKLGWNPQKTHVDFWGHVTLLCEEGMKHE